MKAGKYTELWNTSLKHVGNAGYILLKAGKYTELWNTSLKHVGNAGYKV